MRASQWRQTNFVNVYVGVMQGLECAAEWVIAIYLVVAISTDQQQMRGLCATEHIFEQIKGGRVEPLQVVKEQRQRMLGLSEHADKTLQDLKEPLLRLLRLQLRHGRRLADDQLEFGDQIGDQPRIRFQCPQQCFAPARQYVGALAQ